MTYAESMQQLAAFRSRIASLRREMRAMQERVEPQAVADYRLLGAAGPVSLSQLFGAKEDLIAIHNMGASCAYCTLWADGFNGAYPHLADRAAFVVISPDPPARQRQFAESRGWRFPMVSHQGTAFATDMGYGSEAEGWQPGVSVFRRADGGVVRVSDTALGPGDDFCAVWHFLDLLPDGGASWRPKFKYA